MGVFEVESLAEGTFAVARALADATSTGTITVSSIFSFYNLLF
jgi:phosphoglycerate kinase